MTRITMLMLAAAGLGLAGCNTVEGAGEDIGYTGAVVEETAEETGEEVDEMVDETFDEDVE